MNIFFDVCEAAVIVFTVTTQITMTVAY